MVSSDGVSYIASSMMASQMERNLGKQEILSLYLNQIYLGHGAHGVKAAAMVVRASVVRVRVATAP